MQKVLFIINPKSGTDRIKDLKHDINRHLDHTRFEHEIVYTQYAKHGIAIAKDGFQNGFDIIVSVGGDGSVNDVVHGLYGTKAIMAILPQGSGNGLARSLKIPLNKKRAIQRINEGKIKEIDVGSANGHLFVSNAGVGFDTVITHGFKSSNRRGFLSYLRLILKHIFTYKAQVWKVEADDQKLKLKAFMLTAANAIQLGYGFKIAPKARLNDGFFDLVCIRSFPILLGFRLTLGAFTGRINKSKYVKTLRAKIIRIHHPEMERIQVDGEAIASDSTVEIIMMPKKLKVLA